MQRSQMDNSRVSQNFHDEQHKSNLEINKGDDMGSNIYKLKQNLSVGAVLPEFNQNTITGDGSTVEEGPRDLLDPHERKKIGVLHDVFRNEDERIKYNERQAKFKAEQAQLNFGNIGIKDQDLSYLNKIIWEIEDKAQNYEDKESIKDEFKRQTLYVVKRLQNEKFQRPLDDKLKKEISREVCRIYEQKFEKNKDFNSNIKRITTYRLEELKREVKNNKWKISLAFLSELLRKNPQNKDLLDKIKLKKIPSDLRHTLWRFSQKNKETEQEYSSQLRTNRSQTISQFDINIFNECNNFVSKYVSFELFDPGMVQCMRQILSYYEKKTDRILNDYYYMLAIPLVIAFCEQKYLQVNPAEMIAMFIQILGIIKIFDPLVGLTSAHDEKYLNSLVDKVLDILLKFDEELYSHLNSFFQDGERAGNSRYKQSFALIIKKFVESLGFALLNVDSTLFVWDQIFLKVEPKSIEIYYVFVAQLLCEKDEQMQIHKWLDFAEMIYLKGKALTIENFMSKYTHVLEDLENYKPKYNYNEIPVDAIKLDKIQISDKNTLSMPNNYAVENLRQQYLNKDGRSSGTMPLGAEKTEEERQMDDQMDKILQENVIQDESGQRMVERDGVFVNDSILKSVNNLSGKGADLLDDLGSKGKGKGASKKKGVVDTKKKSAVGDKVSVFC